MKRIIFLLSSAILVLLMFSCNKNDPKPDDSGLFIKFFGTAGVSKGQSMVEVSDGFVLVGTSTQVGNQDTDILVVKTDKNGNRLWEKFIETDKNEGANEVRIKDNGDIYLLGYKTQELQDSLDMWLIRLDSDGEMIDDWTFGAKNASEVGYSLTFLENDSLLLAGTSTLGTNRDTYVIKVIGDEMVWSRSIGVMEETDDLNRVIPLSEGRFLWCGTITTEDESNVRVILTDNNGYMVWQYEHGRFNNVKEFARDVVQTEDGNFMVVGSRGEPGSKDETLWLLKVNIHGALIEHYSPLGGTTSGNSISNTSDGGYVVAGYQQNDETKNDFLIAKINASGGMDWKKTHGGKRNDAVHKVIQSTDGGYVMFGIADLYVVEGENVVYALIKTDSEGEVNKKKK